MREHRLHFRAGSSPLRLSPGDQAAVTSLKTKTPVKRLNLTGADIYDLANKGQYQEADFFRNSGSC